MKKGWRYRARGAHEVLRTRRTKHVAHPPRERTECVNFRHADGVGMEMRVRLGDRTVQSSRAICEEVRMCMQSAVTPCKKARQVIQFSPADCSGHYQLPTLSPAWVLAAQKRVRQCSCPLGIPNLIRKLDQQMDNFQALGKSCYRSGKEGSSLGQPGLQSDGG